MQGFTTKPRHRWLLLAATLTLLLPAVGIAQQPAAKVLDARQITTPEGATANVRVLQLDGRALERLRLAAQLRAEEIRSLTTPGMETLTVTDEPQRRANGMTATRLSGTVFNTMSVVGTVDDLAPVCKDAAATSFGHVHALQPSVEVR